MRKRALSKEILKHRELYLFLLVPVAYILVFAYWPMLGVQAAFKSYNIRLGIWGSPWVGFQNFTKFFRSYQFFRILGNTLRLSLYSLVASFPVPILFALLLHSMPSLRIRKSMQTMTYIPHFISTVVVVGMLFQIFNSRIGIYAAIFGLFHNGAYPRDILASPAVFPHLYVWSGIWQSFGWNSIIYMAALTTVSPELHEAAGIDGASRFQRTLHIDFPAILPTATILLILRMGQIVTIGFEKAYLMQNPLNLRTSEIISTYVYKIGMTSSIGPVDVGYGTAIDFFNSLINLILISGMNALSRRVGETSLW
jgi:putative aldouronate transport system permease protein